MTTITLSVALANLAGTVVVECLLAWLVLRPCPGLFAVMWINLFTNPLAHLAVAAGASFPPVEFGVVVIEGCLLRCLLCVSWLRAITLTLLINGATILLSLVIWAER